MGLQADLKIALIQMACSPNLQENMDTATARIEAAARAGAGLVCLPELFKTPYFCQLQEVGNFALAESIPGPGAEILAKVARAHQVVVVAPLFERRAPGLYHNTAVVLDADGSMAGMYRKMHIPQDPGFEEKFYFTPGDLGFQAIPTRVGRIGVLICWDQWFPEAARLTALKGADILVYPTAIGWHPDEKKVKGQEQLDAWRTVQRGHAIANGVFVAAVNRVGHEKAEASSSGIEFWGNSFVCDPFGCMLAQASADQPELLLADLRAERIEEVRQGWPFLRDRRIDAYRDLPSRFLDSSAEDGRAFGRHPVHPR